MTGVTELGTRVAALLGERGFSQAALGDALSSKRRQSWVSGIISGRFRPSYEDAKEIADFLHVTPMWLIYGDEDSGDTEFVARMRALEVDLDDRGRYTVVKMAENEAEQTRKARVAEATDPLIQQLLALGVAPDVIERARLGAAASVPESGQPSVEVEQEEPESQREAQGS